MDGKRTELPENLKFENLEERSIYGKYLYYELYLWKLENAPKEIHKFCDPKLDKKSREKLLKWIRDVDDRMSCQSLQILFSFSVPSPSAIENILSLHQPLVSAGAGTGYWEMLLQQKGADVISFDKNDVYPEEMRYLPITTGGPNLLSQHPDRALMLCWPDAEEGSAFSLDCLHHYKGNTIIHIGELFGETYSTNPWGQSTSQGFQLELGENFRCILRVELPNWPGHLDSMTVWTRVTDATECDGMPMVHVLPLSPRYYGWEK